MNKLTTGDQSDAARHSMILDEIGELQDQLYFINDLLQCGVRPLNVRLCEWLLRRVVFKPLLEGLRGGAERIERADKDVVDR